MTIDQKLQHFLELSIQDATDQGNSLLSEYKASEDAIFESYKEQALKQAAAQIEIEKEKARREINKELSKQQLHIKRKISRKQAELKDILFEEVKELLDTYLSSPEYTTLLLEQINKAKQFAGNTDMILYIDPRDTDKKEMLESQTGVTLTISEYSFLGGTRAVIESKNILIDNSFEQKFKKAKENFVFGGSSNE